MSTSITVDVLWVCLGASQQVGKADIPVDAILGVERHNDQSCTIKVYGGDEILCKHTVIEVMTKIVAAQGHTPDNAKFIESAVAAERSRVKREYYEMVKRFADQYSGPPQVKPVLTLLVNTLASEVVIDKVYSHGNQSHDEQATLPATIKK